MPEIIRSASVSDLDAVAYLEKHCFPSSEAADRNSFSVRLRSFPECFWVSEEHEHIISMINGMSAQQRDLRDEMYTDTTLYEPNGAWLMLFGVATAPDRQHHGYATRLMHHVIEDTKRKNRQGIVLTCKESLIPFYQRFGFVCEGKSVSMHGDAEWYQMRLIFQDELLRCAESGEECTFYRNGNQFLLYGWGQCDGVFLNVADENGEIVWQAVGRSRKECAAQLQTEFLI
ncbi:MAG: GNAT family N-acetyltransferase [Oscillospiraceae bacterium]|nr:GNAT family N-acetyltransferase [Oscillospiraceae bacterium]